MANKHTTLTSLFSDTADAIREVRNIDDTIPAYLFPEYIRSIESFKILSKPATVAYTLPGYEFPGVCYQESRDNYYTVGTKVDRSTTSSNMCVVVLKNDLTKRLEQKQSVSSPAINNLSCVGMTGNYLYAGFNGNSLALGEELVLRRYLISSKPSVSSSTSYATGKFSGNSTLKMDYEMAACVTIPSTGQLWMMGNYYNGQKSGSKLIIDEGSVKKAWGMGGISKDTPTVDVTLHQGFPVTLFESGVVNAPTAGFLADPVNSDGTNSEHNYQLPYGGSPYGIWSANNKIIVCIEDASISESHYNEETGEWDYSTSTAIGYSLFYGEVSDISAGVPSSWNILHKGLIYSKIPVDVIYCKGSYLVFYHDGTVQSIGDPSYANNLPTSVTTKITFNDSSITSVWLKEVQVLNNKIILTGLANNSDGFVAYYDID